MENVADFVADTLYDLGKPDWTDISSDLQQLVVMDELLVEDRVTIGSGVGMQFNALVNQSTAARNVGLAEPDNVTETDGMIQGRINFRNTQTSWMLIHQLVSMNREPAMIVDFVKQQRIMAQISLANLFERNFWMPPSSTDLKVPFGLPYWVTKGSTKGFTSGMLTGYTAIANISSTTYPRWQNWCAPYTTISRDDFVRQIREAAEKCNFKPQVKGIPSPNNGYKPRYYSNYAVRQALQESMESQNDNLGRDVASMDGGDPMFRGIGVKYVPFLDADTTNPFYGLDLGWFWIAIARGEWMRETIIPFSPSSHNVSLGFTDCMWTPYTRNRRPHFVASNGTTYPS